MCTQGGFFCTLWADKRTTKEMENPDDEEDTKTNVMNFFSPEHGENLMDDLFTKIHSRCRVYFLIQANEIGGTTEIFLTNGDQRFKSLFGYEDFHGLSLQHLSGPATSTETLRHVYTSLLAKEPCEHYLNLYTASGWFFPL
jgi:hypothetical protein